MAESVTGTSVESEVTPKLTRQSPGSMEISDISLTKLVAKPKVGKSVVVLRFVYRSWKDHILSSWLGLFSYYTFLSV